MATIAYCTNCKANFTDKDEVASILGAAPHHCRGCARVAAERGRDEPESLAAAVGEAPADVEGHEEVVTPTGMSREPGPLEPLEAEPEFEHEPVP